MKVGIPKEIKNNENRVGRVCGCRCEDPPDDRGRVSGV